MFKAITLDEIEPISHRGLLTVSRGGAQERLKN